MPHTSFLLPITRPATSPWKFHSGTGIPEELLVSQVQAVAPQQAKQLIVLMVGQGALCQHTVRTVPCAVVPSIFGPSEPAKDEVRLHGRHVSFLVHGIVLLSVVALPACPPANMLG